MKKIIFALSFLIIAGCTSPKFNYVPQTESFSEPPVGKVTTAYVGDSLVSQGTSITLDGIRLNSPDKINWGYTVTPGDFRKVGSDGDKEFYQPFGTRAGGVDKSFMADMWQAIMTKKSTNELCVITIYSGAVCEKNLPYERVKFSASGDNSFQQALLYNGRVGNKINIGYRETSSNMARPAFNNDVEYDLSESKTIAYKGARIQILDATNQSITYKVLSNFR